MRQEKQLLLEEIKSKIEGSNAFLLTRYQKMTPGAATGFRNLLRKAGSDFEVVRKRVLLKAAEAAGVALDEKDLKGHIGIVFTQGDAVEATKTVLQYGKDNEQAVEILGGRFEGALYKAADIAKIAALPSKDEMRAQFLGLLEAPMAQTLGVMDALLTSVLYCMENKAKKDESGAAA